MTNIKVLNLPHRIERRLRMRMINTVELLATLGDDELLLIPTMGCATLHDVKCKLAQYLEENPLPSPGPAHIGSLELSIATYRALRRGGVDTVDCLATMSDQELLRIRNFGETALAEVHSRFTSIS